jgi:sodium/potassium-transporting ATPase subunit alpha
MYLGFASELMLSCLVAYSIPLNIGLGTRDVIFIHYGVPALPFAMIIILWSEFRKLMVIILMPGY